MAISARFCNFVCKITKNRAMEKIILFLIVIGVSALFDYLGKRVKKGADKSRAHSSGHQSPYRQPKASPRPTTDMAFQSIPRFPVEDPVLVMAPETESSTLRPGPATSFLPGEVMEITEPDSISEPSPISSIETDGSPILSVTDNENADHFRRWRQAVIDSEILTPKYRL